jgi:hypothetical protein
MINIVQVASLRITAVTVATVPSNPREDRFGSYPPKVIKLNPSQTGIRLTAQRCDFSGRAKHKVRPGRYRAP